MSRSNRYYSWRSCKHSLLSSRLLSYSDNYLFITIASGFNCNLEEVVRWKQLAFSEAGANVQDNESVNRRASIEPSSPIWLCCLIQINSWSLYCHCSFIFYTSGLSNRFVSFVYEVFNSCYTCYHVRRFLDTMYPVFPLQIFSMYFPLTFRISVDCLYLCQGFVSRISSLSV